MKERERILGAHDLDRNFGPHSNAELRAIEDECIREAVALQEDAGLRAITDGEFRRRIWWSEFLCSLGGVEGNYRGSSKELRDKSGHTVPLPLISVREKVQWTTSVNVRPFELLKAVTKETPKVTIPAPQTLYFFSNSEAISEEAYPNRKALWDDLVEAYVLELEALGKAGCTYVQFDEVVTSCLCDDRQREKLKHQGDDPDRLLHIYIDVLNRISRRRPTGMTIAMHTCRGNYQGHWMAEGGYDPIADYVFNNAEIDTFFLEYDSPRAGTFEPLRFLPKNKSVVLGLISTKTAELEPQDLLKRRIDEAANYASLEQLGLSPQCGFSSNYLGNPVTIEDQKRKLGLTVETAHAVWGDV